MQIEIFTGNSMRAVLSELAPQFERASGYTVSVIYDPAQIMLRRIARGETPDIAILGERPIGELIEQKKIIPSSRRVLGRLRAGVGMRKGGRRPDIGSVDAFKRMLLDARSVAYASEGVTGMHFAKVIEELGIAAELNEKVRTRPGGLMGEFVVSGEADIAIQQIPELMAVPGIEVVGPFPAEIEKITTTTAGVFVSSRNPEAAGALLEFLVAPAAVRVFAAKGFERAP